MQRVSVVSRIHRHSHRPALLLPTGPHERGARDPLYGGRTRRPAAPARPPLPPAGAPLIGRRLSAGADQMEHQQGAAGRDLTLVAPVAGPGLSLEFGPPRCHLCRRAGWERLSRFVVSLLLTRVGYFSSMRVVIVVWVGYRNYRIIGKYDDRKVAGLNNKHEKCS